MLGFPDLRGQGREEGMLSLHQRRAGVRTGRRLAPGWELQKRGGRMGLCVHARVRF